MHPRSLTARPWKMMVGRHYFSTSCNISAAVQLPGSGLLLVVFFLPDFFYPHTQWWEKCRFQQAPIAASNACWYHIEKTSIREAFDRFLGLPSLKMLLKKRVVFLSFAADVWIKMGLQAGAWGDKWGCLNWTTVKWDYSTDFGVCQFPSSWCWMSIFEHHHIVICKVCKWTKESATRYNMLTNE